jgi:hypothetical protein
MNSRGQPKTIFFLLVGSGGHSPVEKRVHQAHQAAARDLLESLLQTARVSQAVVATSDAAWARTLSDLPVHVDVDPPGVPFHFGRRLAELIQRYRAERVLYAGAGSAPLMSPPAWQEVLDGFASSDHVVFTNNLHSSDWVAFQPAQTVVPLVADQDRDNGLAWVLANEAGLRERAMPPTAASRFDIDTPADLLIARAHPGVAPHLRAMLSKLEWPAATVEGVLEVMQKEGGHLAVIGRSSSTAWAALERETMCWVRLFVEERGMIASGRMARGEARSLLADYLERVGPAEFFSALGSMAEAVLLDSRVILGARGLWPPAVDRFNADLLRWEEVREPFLRSLARAASEAGIPMIVGGQSVVAGGLLALLETLAARRQHRCAPF